jgi:hypothetical protein
LISFFDDRRYEALKRHPGDNGPKEQVVPGVLRGYRTISATAASHPQRHWALAKSLGFGLQQKGSASMAAEVSANASWM